MKKFLIVVFSLLSGFVFASCGGNDPVTDATDFPETETPDTPGDDPDNSGTQTDKILIVYFSRTGYNYPDQWARHRTYCPCRRLYCRLDGRRPF